MAANISRCSTCSCNLDTFAGIERGPVDLHASVRSVYRQNRANEIRKRQIEERDLPDLTEVGWA